ncbi:hypothetical protein [Streptomyces sp. SLBN-115]|uniref:hypothetical protein n=1 Tax=Streptomyces sp. SLBN-115 TaxID=2768453 RepID=UPI00117114F0|nr:hypothetical protein [Streptomyces sp. SLBN-115]TQJ46524.1 hypothetical protein FBY34_5918 [Streptomyces sp. SLBN-115]
MRDRYAHTGTVDEGRTHWRRSALMFVPCTLAVGALGIALAEGAIAASFAVSGTAFKVSASEVTAQGVSSFPSSIGGSADDAKPVLLAAVKDGTVSHVSVSHLGTAGGGRLKALWVHADRLVADDYTFRPETPGQVQTIDVDLDIPQVDIYVTQLSGSLPIPVIDVATPRICIGADVVPANLPIAVQLPELSVTAVEAGQVLVDAETVHFSDLSAHSHTR